MSIDSYLCFCCMSTDGLCNLFDKNHENNHTDALKELFGITCSDENSYDGYICADCTRILKEALQFKQQLFKTIYTLQSFGLITINKVGGCFVVEKVKTSTDNVLSSVTNENPEVKNVMISSKKLADKHQEMNITVSQIKNNKLESIEVKKNSQIIHSFLSNDPVKKLERDNSITKVPPDVDFLGAMQDLKCMICMDILPNTYSFNTHMNKHFPNYVCEECGRSYMTEKRLKRHRLSHNTGPFVCQECGVEFSKYPTYDSHRRRKHAPPASFPCAHCSAQFATRTRRERHYNDAHDIAPKYKCAQCTASFITSGLLNAHMKYKHLKLKRCVYQESFSGSHQGTQATRLHKCHLCNKSYLRKKALTVHMKLHNDDKRFCCDICGRRFLQKCTLITHLKVHSRVKKKPTNLEVPALKGGEENARCEVNTIEIEIEPLVVGIQSKTD